jgi:hypothetical protein
VVESSFDWFLDYIVYNTGKSSSMTNATIEAVRRRNPGPIAAAAIGGLLGIAALITLAVWLYRRKRFSKSTEEDSHSIKESTASTSTQNHCGASGNPEASASSSLGSPEPTNRVTMTQNQDQSNNDNTGLQTNEHTGSVAIAERPNSQIQQPNSLPFSEGFEPFLKYVTFYYVVWFYNISRD